ncbi:uncharacterized protein LOC106763624 [Vigna radiata var. radiata]|uniref:Uncharacterized protein LOC106763624 n=1 Tax=Vigna radiata var. radiata TaxID=3916 RepID=A0A1S3UB77_VIGRR|nr:uncharacterized protein LOC106763624 [Vigna radiata var. radiata]
MTYTALMRMRQGREESLKGFMERFNRTTRQVRNIDQRLIVNALTSTLRPGPFVDYLYAEEPQTMAELQHKLTSFIRIEEGRAYHKGQEVEPRGQVKRENVNRRVHRMEEGPNGQRRMDQSRILQHTHHTPLNAPQVRVMEEALRADLLKVVWAPTPLGADENKYCRYHQNRGHTTEDCTTLKDKLENLIQAGHLQKFVQCYQTRAPNVTNYKRDRRSRQDRSRSRSRSRERVTRGVINTISGGFAGGGPSVSARKRHLRGLHHVNQAGVDRKSMPVISFSDEDFHAPDPDQDDPMVIVAMIARYQVGKVLIDQGSSANILYWKTFQQMDIPEGVVRPFHEQIVGFAGERVDTRGYVELKVSLGLEKDAKEL